MEQQDRRRLKGALLLHIFGADRSRSHRSRYSALSIAEKSALLGLVEHESASVSLTDEGSEARSAGISAMAEASSLLAPPADDTAIPTGEEIASRLAVIGGVSSASRLKTRMVEEGWIASRIELGVQRAIDDGSITMERDWTLSVP